jgi:hypothetical protein
VTPRLSARSSGAVLGTGWAQAGGSGGSVTGPNASGCARG